MTGPCRYTRILSAGDEDAGGTLTPGLDFNLS
jgi:hypothetical protein